jgi:hypothetical protein
VAEGYKTEVGPGKGTPNYLVLATRSMMLVGSEMTLIRQKFDELAAGEDGDYDGWGTPIRPRPIGFIRRVVRYTSCIFPERHSAIAF